VNPVVNTTPGKLGRYELIGKIATGGMGEIFLARLGGAAGFEKLYVVKKILPHLAGDPRFRGMLIDEARVASRMSHPNICQVYELEETDGQLYIVMEYLEGVTVLPLLRRASRSQTPLPLGLITGVISQTCEALHYAHELNDRDGSPLNIVHRDVTPSNVFVTESGVAKVVDFGIAKVKNASAQTQTGTVKGKYAYMAPEQLRGLELDRRVDVFAVGILLFEMLSLRRLFQRKTDYLTFRAVMEQEIPNVRRYRPDVSEAMTALLAKGLQRDAALRYSNIRELGGALLDATSGTRPWSNSEIGDFLKNNFEEMIRKRTAALQTATQRDVLPTGRLTVPALADIGVSADQESDTDDDEFPSVETDAQGVVMPPIPSAVADFSGVTPPPFSNDPTRTNDGRKVEVVPFGRSTNPGIGGISQSMSHQQLNGEPAKRSWILPVVATVGVGLLGLAGVAVYLLWQKSNEAPQTILIPDVQVTARVDAAMVNPPVLAPQDAREDNIDAKNAKKPPPPQPVDRSAKRIAGLAVSQCSASTELDDASKSELKSLTLHVSNSKTVTKVELSPGKFTFSPFGSCLRNALSGKTLVVPTQPGQNPGSALTFPIILTNQK
jgi:serine/threonine protein kinase